MTDNSSVNHFDVSSDENLSGNEIRTSGEVSPSPDTATLQQSPQSRVKYYTPPSSPKGIPRQHTTHSPPQDTAQYHTLQSLQGLPLPSSIPQGAAQQHLLSSLPQGAAQQHLLSSLSQGTAQQQLLSSLPQVAAQQHLLSSLPQETAQQHLSSLPQGTAQQHLLSSLPQVAAQQHLLSSLQQGTAQQHQSLSSQGTGQHNLISTLPLEIAQQNLPTQRKAKQHSSPPQDIPQQNFSSSIPQSIFQLSLPQEAAQQNLLSSLQQGTAQQHLSSLPQVAAQQHLLSSLQQGTAQQHLLSSIPQGTAQQHLLSSIPQGTAQQHLAAQQHLLSSLQQGTTQQHLLSSLPQGITQQHLLSSLPQGITQQHLIPQGTAQQHLLSSIPQVAAQQHLLSSIPQVAAQQHILSSLPQGTTQQHLSSLPQVAAQQHLLSLPAQVAAQQHILSSLPQGIPQQNVQLGILPQHLLSSLQSTAQYQTSPQHSIHQQQLSLPPQDQHLLLNAVQNHQVQEYKLDGVVRVPAGIGAKDLAAGKLQSFEKTTAMKFIFVVNNMTQDNLIRSDSSGEDSWPFSIIKKNECVAALFDHSQFKNLNVVFTADDNEPGIRTVMLCAHWTERGRSIGIYAGMTQANSIKIHREKNHDHELDGNKAAITNPGSCFIYEYNIIQLKYAQFGVPAGEKAAMEAIRMFTTFCIGSMPGFTFVVNNLTGYDLMLAEKHEVQGTWPLGNIKKGECAVAGFDKANMSLAARYTACIEDLQQRSISLAGSWPAFGTRKIYIGEGIKAIEAWKNLSATCQNWSQEKATNKKFSSAHIQEKEKTCVYIYELRMYES